MCNQSILLKGSHIDHIKPLSKYPNLALETTNLQITSSDCNLSKHDTQ
ncbi:HNH endonuclease [Gloeothece citriformis]|nr:HNH endonuclease [Gloeothece citriformis]